MSDLTEFKTAPPCGTAEALAALPEDQRQLLNEAFADTDCVGNRIGAGLNRRLKEAGLDHLCVSQTTVRRHRRTVLGTPGDACVCPVGPFDG